MKIELTNKVLLTDIPLEVYKSIQSLFTIPNPEYVEAEKNGISTVGIPKTLELYENTKEGVICPKGTIGMVYKLGHSYQGIKPIFYDNRRILNPVNFSFHGELEPSYQKAADLVSRYTTGRWEPPTGIDKKRFVSYLIAQREQPTLIVVDSTEHLDEWDDHLKKDLKIKAADVGKIAKGRVRMGKKITIAMVQTLHKRAAEVAPHIGHLILDAKTSRVTGKQYLEIVEQFDCKFQLWLTSSSSQSVFLDNRIACYAGPIIEQNGKYELLIKGKFPQVDGAYIPREPTADPSKYSSSALSEMSSQDSELDQIIGETFKKANEYGIVIVSAERVEDCEYLAGLFKEEYDIQAAVLTGKESAKQKRQFIMDLISRKCGFLIATDQLLNYFLR